MGWLSRFSAHGLSVLRGESRYRLFEQIAGRLHASPRQIEAGALEALNRILLHAWHSTTAYRRTIEEAGLRPGELTRLDEVSRIAITQKSDIRNDTRAYMSSSIPPARYQKKSTSGSSGTPLTFYRDWDYVELGAAGTMRNMALAGWKPGDAFAYVWGYERDVETPLQRFKSMLSRVYYLNAFRQDAESMRGWVRLLRRERIRYIYGYPSSVALFARHVRDSGADLPMKAVFLTAEKYFPFERELIEAAFQCKSYDQYGSSEVQNIAFECPAGNLHVASDFVLVEQHVFDGEALPQLITTSFHNRVLPFIRYALGDFGAVPGGRCGCGIGTPLIEIHGGSRYDFLLTPDGAVHGAVLERIFQKIDGIERYQIIQHAIDSYTIRTVIMTGAGRPAIEEAVRSSGHSVLEQLMGRPVAIRFEFPAAIAAGATGKFRFVCREC